MGMIRWLAGCLGDREPSGAMGWLMRRVVVATAVEFASPFWMDAWGRAGLVRAASTGRTSPAGYAGGGVTCRRFGWR